jgi:hypothetical protein
MNFEFFGICGIIWFLGTVSYQSMIGSVKESISELSCSKHKYKWNQYQWVRKLDGNFANEMEILILKITVRSGHFYLISF